jgi:Uma2 family endonuclease
MLSVLDSPTLRARVSPLSVASYHNLGEFNEHGRRTELIRGIVVEKMSKSPLRTSIATHLYRLILAGIPEGYSAWKEEPLTLRDSEPEPDVAIVHGTRRDYLHSHPSSAALVVEVAVTSLAEDRELAALYAEAEVAEYWIVLPSEHCIEVYRQPENGRYREMRLYTGSDSLECASVPGAGVALAELFAGL